VPVDFVESSQGQVDGGIVGRIVAGCEKGGFRFFELFEAVQVLVGVELLQDSMPKFQHLLGFGSSRSQGEAGEVLDAFSGRGEDRSTSSDERKETQAKNEALRFMKRVH